MEKQDIVFGLYTLVEIAGRVWCLVAITHFAWKYW